MPRRAQTVEQERRDIKRRYRRGRKTETVIRGESALTDVEREIKREIACYLKAQDFSYTYIADALGLTKDVVKKWFQEPEMQTRVREVFDDITAAGVKLLKSYAIEFIEMLAELARTAEDKIALTAIIEGLDRMGIAKVNKSESISAQTIREEREVDITDKSGLVESLKEADPTIQVAAAEKLEELLALAAEHTDRAVTHG